MNVGLCYGSDELHLTAYTGSDFAGDLTTAKSTTSCVVEFNGAAISWGSKLQSVVTTSTCEAEHVAACYGAKEVVWLTSVLRTLGLLPSDSMPTALCMDNHGALFLVQNPATNQKTKHIRVSFHYIREAVARGEIDVVPVATEFQHADMFTKSLSVSVFKANCAAIGLNECE
jgi:hypothetical protein